MNLDHLHPDRIRIGSVGVFAGDWAWTPDADGAMRIPVAFVGTLTDTWNGWAVFTCTREVAEAIVADQHQQRDQYRHALRDQGVAEDDLDRQVNASLAILTFDGNTIVADQRAMYDDPQAIERIDPNPDGRYVVMGWNWCWLPVDPADCDRIAGILPPPEQQQEFVELVHTPGMRLPHDRLRIHVEHQSPTTLGLALTGTLTLDGHLVGAIRDDGDGQGARLEAAEDPRAGQGLAGYLDRCRFRGNPVSQQRLLDALVEQHYLTALITAADANQQTVLRLVDEDGRTRVAYPVAPPRSGAARQELAHAVRNNGVERSGEWQLWGGTRWTYLIRVGDQPDPPAPASAEQD